MTRSIKTVKRPDPHVYFEDPDEPEDFSGNRPCGYGWCRLPKSNSVHVTTEDLMPPLSQLEREVRDRMLGEAS